MDDSLKQKLFFPDTRWGSPEDNHIKGRFSAPEKFNANNEISLSKAEKAQTRNMLPPLNAKLNTSSNEKIDSFPDKTDLIRAVSEQIKYSNGNIVCLKTLFH